MQMTDVLWSIHLSSIDVGACREKIFTAYSKEIPYSCEVAVTAFKDQERLLKMNATIYTTRESHLPILIGTKGA